LAQGTNGMTVNIGGSGGEGMSAGRVDVGNSGIILTAGDDSHGILAQSLGGGGGVAGMSLSISTYKVKADASTSGKESVNRVAVNVGGSGGSGAVADAVTVTNTGGIGTEGASAVGI